MTDSRATPGKPKPPVKNRRAKKLAWLTELKAREKDPELSVMAALEKDPELWDAYVAASAFKKDDLNLYAKLRNRAPDRARFMKHFIAELSRKRYWLGSTGENIVTAWRAAKLIVENTSDKLDVLAKPASVP